MTRAMLAGALCAALCVPQGALAQQSVDPRATVAPKAVSKKPLPVKTSREADDRIYIGWWRADPAFRRTRNEDGYYWTDSDGEAQPSGKPHVGISPTGYLEGGSYFSIRLSLSKVRELGDVCHAIKLQRLFKKCSLDQANALFPELAPVQARSWFIDGTRKAVIGFSGPHVRDPRFPNNARDDIWLITSRSAATDRSLHGIATTTATVQVRPLLEFWFADATPEVRKRGATRAQKRGQDVLRAATERWAVDLARLRKLVQHPGSSAAASEANAVTDALAVRALARLSKPVEDRNSYCLVTPREGKYAQRLFVISLGESARSTKCLFGSEGFRTGYWNYTPYVLSATVLLDGTSAKVLRAGFAVGPEIEEVQNAYGHVLETGQGDFFVTTQTNTISPARGKASTRKFAEPDVEDLIFSIEGDRLTQIGPLSVPLQ